MSGEKNRIFKVMLDCLKKDRTAIIVFAAMSLFNTATFILYDVMFEPLIYSEILTAILLLMIIVVDFIIECRASAQREQAITEILVNGAECVAENTLRDGDYCEMIRLLEDEICRLKTEYCAKEQADGEYYTAWIHQIKTPIAVMKLWLDDDSEKSIALRCELARIEQYVEMVLDYIRLDGSSNDLMIREYSLDEIIRETLRKFAPQFIMRKLKLCYVPTDESAVTDRKWLSFILEQLISNAVKYTPEGEIRVTAKGGVIRISDSGIGIAPEDIPRIFEKGYTGVNGRLGQKSSGLGLFLTGKAAALLSIRVECESRVGAGSTFSVILPKKY